MLEVRRALGSPALRLPLVVTEAEIYTALERIAACLPAAVRVQPARKHAQEQRAVS